MNQPNPLLPSAIRSKLTKESMFRTFRKVIEFGFVKVSDNCYSLVAQIIVKLNKELELLAECEMNGTTPERMKLNRGKAEKLNEEYRALRKDEELVAALMEFKRRMGTM